MTFYHIFPIGYCDAPPHHDPWSSGPHAEGAPLQGVTADLPRIADLGFSGLYLGPLFLSTSHGYDTADYRRVDTRLGSDETLATLVARAHELGLSVVLDGVFNHVGRDFWAFRDLRENRRQSAYRDWFCNISFDHDNRFGDGFVYEGWEGVEELVALNHDNPEVQEHLLQSAEEWIERFNIDGIRLDVAYSLPFWFLDRLGERVRACRPEFWLLGEVIHGDYNEFLAPGRLDSVTNYECYKGLWSSFNDRNLYEIAHSLDRLFGDGGLLADAVSRGCLPYNFTDNHDVDRIATALAEPDHIFPLLALLFTIPGIPSVYYGSEFGMQGTKVNGDAGLRPSLQTVLRFASRSERADTLSRYIRDLVAIRRRHPVLGDGSYEALSVANTALAFARRNGEQELVIAVQTEDSPTQIALPDRCAGRYRSLYDGRTVTVSGDRLIDLPAYGSAILQRMD